MCIFKSIMLLKVLYLLSIYTCFVSSLQPSLSAFPHNLFIKSIPSTKCIYYRYFLPALYLDSKDILEEDDFEFLIKVRKQMSESNYLQTSITSKDITNRIKEFLSSPIDLETKTLFSSYLKENKASIDVVNVILIIEGSGRNNFDFLQVISWPMILEAMNKPSVLLTSSMIYRGISCLRSLQMGDPNSHQFQKHLWEHIKNSSITLNANDICPAIYSLQSVNCQSLYVREIIKYLTRCMGETRADPIPAKPICSAIYGLRKQKPTAEIRLLLWEIANRIEEMETYYHTVNVCIAMNGLQCMDDCYPEVRRLLSVLLTKAIDAEEQGIDKAGDREISMALFGLQKMGSSSNLKSRSNTGSMHNNDYLTAAVQSMIAQGGSSLGIERDLLNLGKYTTINSNIHESAHSHPKYYKVADETLTMGVESTEEYDLNGNKHKQQQQQQRQRITPELQSALIYISSLLDYFEGPFEAKRLGFAMMGLSRLNGSKYIPNYLLARCLKYSLILLGNIREVRDIIQKLSLKAKDAWGDVSGQEISMILHGLINLQSSSSEVRTLVSRIVPLVKRCVSMTAPDARSALTGLQGMHSDSGKEITALFSAVADLLERSNIKFTTPMEISSALYGLQGISADSIYGRKLLSLLNNMISTTIPSSNQPPNHSAKIVERSKRYSSSEQTLKGRDIAMSLYGLRSTNGGSKETLDILSKLTTLITSTVTKDPKSTTGILLSANDVATCLYGLQSFNSNQREVIELLKVLNPCIANVQGKFNAKGLSMALNGLQGFDSRQPEVRELIQGINKIMTRTIDGFQGFDDFFQISAALYGLSSLNSKYEEVSELVTLLEKLISQSNGPFSSLSTPSTNTVTTYQDNKRRKIAVDIPKADKVGMALYGIQRLSPHIAAVDSILIFLEDYIAAMSSPNGVAIGMAFQCFRNCKGKPTGTQRKILLILSEKLLGYSTKKLKINPTTLENSSSRIIHNEQYATIRSVIGGISGFDFTDDTVIAILRVIAQELLNPTRVNIEKEQDYIDRSTLQLLVNTFEKVITFNNLDISKEPEILTVANIVKNFFKSSKRNTSSASITIPIRSFKHSNAPV